MAAAAATSASAGILSCGTRKRVRSSSCTTNSTNISSNPLRFGSWQEHGSLRPLPSCRSVAARGASFASHTTRRHLGDGRPCRCKIPRGARASQPSGPSASSEEERTATAGRSGDTEASDLKGLAPAAAARRQLLLAAAVTACLQVGRAAVAAVSDRPLEAYDEQKLLEQNRRIQRLNQAPENFPGFVRQGFEVKVLVGPEYQVSPTGLIYWDEVVGSGDPPVSGQEVEFHYVGFNESGRRVDSTYMQGRPARTRVGINGMIPGFEEGISGMRVGGRRRIIIPPELGPPTGPSTFFSAKQYEVFDVDLLAIRSCTRRQIIFYSDVICS